MNTEFIYFTHALYSLAGVLQATTALQGTMLLNEQTLELNSPTQCDDGGTWGGGTTDYGCFAGTVQMPLVGGGDIVLMVFQAATAIRVLNIVQNAVIDWSANLPPVNASGTQALCLAEGTAIATPGGTRPVEALATGDLVRTADGRVVPVLWVGRQTIHRMFWGPRGRMVHIRAGALGNDRDLFVTPDHGMVVGDCLVNASALVNGAEIDWVPLSDTPDRFTVYHIETEAHDILLANGAPTESYIDTPGRRAFDNFAEYEALYGAERVIAENPLPRISSPRLLPRRRAG